MSGKREAPASGRLRRLGRGLYRLAVVLSALIVLLYTAYHFFIHPPQIPAVQTNADVSVSGEDTPLIGLARREQVYTFLLVGVDNGNGNADTIIVACFDVPARRVGLVSIPRDTIVDRVWSRYPKINGAYGKGGVELVRQEASRLLGIPIDYYVKVDLSGFVALVDKLGGVDFDVPVNMNYDDPWQNLSIHYTKGLQHLTGQQTMEVVRFRHNNDGSGYSDVGRTRTQQALLTAVAKKAMRLSSVTKLADLLSIVQENVDTDISGQDMTYFASNAIYVDLETGLDCVTLTGRGDARYHGYSWCYELDASQTLTDINRLLNPYTTPVTEEMTCIIKADSYG